MGVAHKDSSDLDAVSAAHERATFAALNHPVAVINGEPGQTIVDVLCALKLDRVAAERMVLEVTRAYQDEVLAAWSAAFTPIPIVMPKRPPSRLNWRVTILTALWILLTALAAVGAVAVLNIMVEAIG